MVVQANPAGGPDDSNCGAPHATFPTRANLEHSKGPVNANLLRVYFSYLTLDARAPGESSTIGGWAPRVVD